LDELSMRVRVGRNLAAFNLPGAMDREERIKFEKTMLKAFDSLVNNPAYGGQVYSLSPDHGEGVANPNLISEAKYNELVKAHVMFKDMAADPYLKSAGIANDWPYGRGCYVSEDQEFIIWFGEEDQLRIMCMKKGTKLNEVFDRLREALKVVESIDGIEFATSKKYGYVTSCPSNLGTGMRASVHVKLPNLTSDGTDKKAKEVCKPLGLSVRGTGGEHTPIGKDGTVDISPSSRLFIKEAEIIEKLYEGLKLLMDKESAAASE
jgi:creatine kinase